MSVIEAHPVIADLCLAYSGNRIELLVFGDESTGGSVLGSSSACSVAVRACRDTGSVSHITCAEWYPHDYDYAPAAACHDSFEAYLRRGGAQLGAGPSDQLLSFASGSSSGALSVCSWNANSLADPTACIDSEVLYDPAASSNKKQCTSLSWNRQLKHLLAAGFDKSRVQSTDFCFAVWDATLGPSAAPVYRDQHAQHEPVASCAWLPYDPHIIAAGTSISALRLHDIRMKPGGADAAYSIMAHPATRPRKVRGIRPDPFNAFTIATYSDSPGEPVKIWDLRKGGATVKPKVIISPAAAAAYDPTEAAAASRSTAMTSPSAVTVADVAWSQARPNMIAIALLQQRSVGFYKTHRTAEGSILRSPFSSITLKDSARSLSWSRGASSNGYERTADEAAEGDTAPAEAAFRPNHSLLVACSSSYHSLRIVDESALAVASSGFTLANDGRRTYISTTHTLNDMHRPRDGWKCGLRLAACQDDSALLDDTERLLRLRLAEGYSLSPASNLQVLSEEMELRRGAAAAEGRGDGIAQLVDLYRMWQWVERLEGLQGYSLTSCGVIDILGRLDGAAASSAQMRSSLLATAYSSAGRSDARVMCGWASNELSDADHALIASSGSSSSDKRERESSDGLLELEGILGAHEADGGFERATALALWHGSIDLAVGILQRSALEGGDTAADLGGSEGSTEGSVQGGPTQSPRQQAHSPEYMHLVSLAAMCIAGYSSSRGSWATMCVKVIEQLQQSSCGGDCAYLVAACKFLLANFSSSTSKGSDKYADILNDDSLALEDRVAFACTYVEDGDLLGLLQGHLRDCCSAGRLEGLVLTGLAGLGLGIVQKHLDLFCDVQTVALLVGRVIEERPPATGAPYPWCREWAWLQEYRSLLNRWQLYIERASLDVDLGRRHRHTHPPNLSVGGVKSGSSSRGKEGAKTAPPVRMLYELPPHNALPHVTLKCHYCSSALPADSLQHAQQAAHLRKAKAVLNCCPSCRKPLPKCYVCQMYLGLVNPHLELNRILNERRNLRDKEAPEPFSYDPQGGRSGGEHAHSTLAFGRWLHFCMHCRHGGHALCIDEWFAGRVVCGVNGCNCCCKKR